MPADLAQIPIFISLFFVLGTSRRRSSRSTRARSWTGSASSTSPSPRRTGGGRCSCWSTSPASCPRRTSCRPRCRRRSDPADGPPDRLHPVHPQLPVRPDDLLADDEPLDDRAGHRHAPADPASPTGRQALVANTTEGARAAGRSGQDRLLRGDARDGKPASRGRRAASSARRAAAEAAGDEPRGHRRGHGRDRR